MTGEQYFHRTCAEQQGQHPHPPTLDQIAKMFRKEVQPLRITISNLERRLTDMSGVIETRFEEAEEHIEDIAIRLTNLENHQIAEFENITARDFELPTRALRQLVVAYKRLYASLSGEPFPQQPEQQLLQALGSLHGPAPALVQAAVHGQAAGFVPAGGAPSGGCWWEQAQADDVGGGRAGQRRISQRASREWAEGAGLDEDERVENFSSLEEAMPAVYAQLVECQDVLSRHTHGIQGVDFVVRDGQGRMRRCRGGRSVSSCILGAAVWDSPSGAGAPARER
ncbi:unnamed protein product [Prorocentrum cordatum]|uniref:Uncharacterized protein n=1 Tax=Prorocentrum cordatum TaxID=2364126 RepID=A0ABN9PKT3_9DINO|nr:unnamed protein product [Polarella glacialis]